MLVDSKHYYLLSLKIKQYVLQIAAFYKQIIHIENPYAKKVGDSLGFQVLFDGKPLADRTVFASNKETEKQKFKTDRNGKLTMKIEKNGLWLVHMVVMQRCLKDCGEADWESFWGAISFGV